MPISDFVFRANAVIWGAPMLFLILGAGIYLSFRTHFVQIRKFRFALKSTVGRAFGKSGAKSGGMTPFQAMTTALGGTVGTGNIAGVAGAITLGGPGAVFWMWVSAMFGMCTKYSEIFLAVRFREKDRAGQWVGGPMYYIKNGLGKKFLPLAAAFSVFGCLASLGIGNIAQANTISGCVISAVTAFVPAAAAQGMLKTVSLTVGLFCAGTVLIILFGGPGRLGRVTEWLVPAMSAVYILASLAVIFSNAENILPALKRILTGAFSPKAAVGGAFGIGFRQAAGRGIGRGVFSNEAGLGSSPMAHASAGSTDPVSQGLYGIFEVFADTLVICTLTAFAILTSPIAIPYGQSAGAGLAAGAFAEVFGQKAAGVVMAVCIFFFALSSMLSWALYGERCSVFLFGERSAGIYRIIFAAAAIPGSTMSLSLVWSLSEAFNGLMAVPNLIALVLLSGIVSSQTERRFPCRQLQRVRDI